MAQVDRSPSALPGRPDAERTRHVGPAPIAPFSAPMRVNGIPTCTSASVSAAAPGPSSTSSDASPGARARRSARPTARTGTDPGTGEPLGYGIGARLHPVHRQAIHRQHQRRVAALPRYILQRRCHGARPHGNRNLAPAAQLREIRIGPQIAGQGGRGPCRQKQIEPGRTDARGHERIDRPAPHHAAKCFRRGCVRPQPRSQARAQFGRDPHLEIGLLIGNPGRLRRDVQTVRIPCQSLAQNRACAPVGAQFRAGRRVFGGKRAGHGQSRAQDRVEPSGKQAWRRCGGDAGQYQRQTRGGLWPGQHLPGWHHGGRPDAKPKGLHEPAAANVHLSALSDHARALSRSWANYRHRARARMISVKGLAPANLLSLPMVAR